MVPISVNLSQVNFYNVNLGTEMKETLSQHGISQELIHIEVTESTYMEEPEKMMATIKELQADGFVILLDDFGSGYSSLNALKDIPVDILKIDLEFLLGDLKKMIKLKNLVSGNPYGPGPGAAHGGGGD